MSLHPRRVIAGNVSAYRAAQIASWAPDVKVRACHCVGPRPGEPVCPCRMQAITTHNGRYVEIIDHGPAPVALTANDLDGFED